MKLTSTCILLTLLLGTSIIYSQNPIVIGEKKHLFSKTLNENRELLIYLPDSYGQKKYVQTRYPVVYLLDGETNFHSYTGLQQFLSKGPYASVPQLIVVGIVNTNRTRDLTPTAAGRQAFYDKGAKMFAGSGGNAQFIQFLEKELRPFIDSHYRSSGFNMLIGHSFGGLTAVNILLHQPTLFNAYCVIDPNLWWDDTYMLRQADSLFPQQSFGNRSLYVAKAYEKIVPQDTSTDHSRAIDAFAAKLKSYHLNGLRWYFQFYPNDDHGTIPVSAEYDALKFIFEGHQVHVKQAVVDSTLVEKQYAHLSRQTGFQFIPSESYLDWMGNYCISIKKLPMACWFYKYWASTYPKSSEACQALANAFEKMGNKPESATWQSRAQKLQVP